MESRIRLNADLKLFIISIAALGVWTFIFGPVLNAQLLAARALWSISHSGSGAQSTIEALPITELYHGPLDVPMIALTFDVEEDPRKALLVLDVLKEKQVRATMFIMGDWAKRHPAVLQRIVDDGHELGNHSYSHFKFSTLNSGWVHSEIVGTEQLVHEQAGATTRPYFRFPYGDRTDENMRQVQYEEGYQIIKWDVDPKDWKYGPETTYRNIVANAHSGAIVVLHLGSTGIAGSIARVIDELRSKGFELVTIGDMIGTSHTDMPYEGTSNKS